MVKVKIIFPDERWVTEERIMGWCYDAQADCKIETRPYTLEEAIEALEGIGWITATKQRIYLK